jgi:hypothetical protein
MPVDRLPLRRQDGAIRAYAVVDRVDLELVSQFAWHYANGYAVHTSRKGGKRMTMYMHCLILGLGIGSVQEGDHLDLNRLNNRRSNLRVVTRAQNMQNRSAHRTSPFGDRTSRNRGVGWHKHLQRWRARATLDGITYELGYFDDEEEAASVVAEFRQAHMPFSVEGV